jgi:hypothetical protein
MFGPRSPSQSRPASRQVRDAKERTWDDLPWAAHPVTLVFKAVPEGAERREAP